MDKRTIIAITLAFAFSSAIVIAPWVYQFHGASFSGDPASWGVFGDYFGGVLSTLVSIFGFVALLITIRIQRDAIDMQIRSLKAQWKGIEQDGETRDDDIYYRHALQCLDEALTVLSNPEDGQVHRERVAWLQSARLILTAKELASKISSTSMRTAYKASEKLIQSRFQSRLDPISNPGTLQPGFFSGPNWDSYFNNRPSNRLEKHSVYVVYEFTSWDSSEVDIIDSVVGKIDTSKVSQTYPGAKLYLDIVPRTTQNNDHD